MLKFCGYVYPVNSTNKYVKKVKLNINSNPNILFLKSLNCKKMGVAEGRYHGLLTNIGVVWQKLNFSAKNRNLRPEKTFTSLFLLCFGHYR